MKTPHIASPVQPSQSAWAAVRARLSPALLQRILVASFGLIALCIGLTCLAIVLPHGSGDPLDGGPALSAPPPSTSPQNPAVAPTEAVLPIPVLRFRSLSPADAYKINEAMPASTQQDSPARPYVANLANASSRTLASLCLTQAVYYEAASESLEGQRAVAQVVLNRMHDARFPHSVCGVVFQGSERPTGCQFSFTCDGSLARPPRTASWARARLVADNALDGYVMQAIGHATHYHTVWVSPYWSPGLVKLGRIGAHIFYRWPSRSEVGGQDFAEPLAAATSLTRPPQPEPLGGPNEHAAAAFPAMSDRPRTVASTETAIPPAPPSSAARAPVEARVVVDRPVIPATPNDVASVVAPEAPYRSKRLGSSIDNPRFAARDGGP